MTKNAQPRAWHVGSTLSVGAVRLEARLCLVAAPRLGIEWGLILPLTIILFSQIKDDHNCLIFNPKIKKWKHHNPTEIFPNYSRLPIPLVSERFSSWDQIRGRHSKSVH